MKTSRTTLPLADKDREAIALIREHYSLHSDADAIRMAIRELDRSIKREKNVYKTSIFDDV